MICTMNAKLYYTATMKTKVRNCEVAGMCKHAPKCLSMIVCKARSYNTHYRTIALHVNKLKIAYSTSMVQ